MHDDDDQHAPRGAGMDEWGGHAEHALTAAGHRAGGARRAVVELLARQDCCLTAQEIHEALRAEGQRTGIASVYRALDVLTDLRLVHRLDLGGGAARYEPAQPSGAHHHHLVCRGCGQVTPFADAALEDAIHGVAERLSHEVDEHEVVLRGWCAECRAEGRGAPPA